MNSSFPGTALSDRKCVTCKPCPDGQVEVSGCDGKEKDRVCGKVDDFKGSVTTGTDCKVNNVNVGNPQSNSTWFFKFADKDAIDVFGAPVGVEKPCDSQDCKKSKAFTEQPGLMTAGGIPTKAIITSKGKDGWCIKSVCLASKKWGKKYTWTGTQWMNPGGGGPAAGKAWDFLPLRIEAGSECPGLNAPAEVQLDEVDFDEDESLDVTR